MTRARRYDFAATQPPVSADERAHWARVRATDAQKRAEARRDEALALAHVAHAHNARRQARRRA